ncbi:hypothetical protein [Caballeronia concitans]|uniref:Uncharacterized protein n=1 Tax=Caballeronia concitans TaxID=1777133 RepID=A0A658QVN0_9BURK|nr:hypothetical protein [Caballeronia concitans]KIG03541.1 hypothetical protein BurMR1_4503 [Burkholderia sp. MR1]SAL26548.1 hypothetical protein AWB72_02049 [Caballeronia concitans]
MKPLKFVIAAIMLSSASLAIAQTSAPAADEQSTQAPRQSHDSQECVGPASYCTVFFGGS